MPDTGQRMPFLRFDSIPRNYLEFLIQFQKEKIGINM